MNFKKCFLTLSIRHQISLVIELIAFFSLIIILVLFYLYSNIILKIRSRSREQYFYERYKLIFDSQIDFLSNLLHQYEQIIKTFHNELYYYSMSLKDFNETFFYNIKIAMKITNYSSSSSRPSGPPSSSGSPPSSGGSGSSGPPSRPPDSGGSSQTSITEYYQLNYGTANEVCYNFNLTKNYVFIHNYFNQISSLDIIYLGINGKIAVIFKDFLLISLMCKYLFSSDKDIIKENEALANNGFDNFFENDVIKGFHYVAIKKMLDNYKDNEFSLIGNLFPDKIDIFQNYTYIGQNEDEIKNYLDNISHYFIYINYLEEFSFSYDNIHKFIQEFQIIKNYFNMMLTRVQNFININSIPVYKENNTIYSKDSCFAFLFKQIILLNISTDYNFNLEDIEKIYDNLKVGESDISDCIFSEKYNIKYKNDANFFIKNRPFHTYYSLKNKRDAALFQLSQTSLGEKFFGVKHTFPDYTSIKSFHPENLIVEQLNLYTFTSFHEPALFIDGMENFYMNIQFFVILLTIYLWILIFIYLKFRLIAIHREVIKPINDLNEMINQLDIKEENQLKYEPDDSINELFKLCNELLLGKYKKKLLHASEVELEKMDKDNNYFNNMKIDRKIIEEMIEDKNKYNNAENDIFIYRISQEKSNNGKIYKRERKKLNTVLNSPFNNNLYKENKALFDLYKGNIYRENNIDRFKKKSANEAFLFNKYEELFKNSSNDLLNIENDDNILEMKSALNYKNLYEVVNFVFNYDVEYGKNFVPKQSRLLYKENIKNYNKTRKGKIKKLSSIVTKEENKSKTETVDKSSTFNEIKDDANLKLDDFDKSVVSAFNTKNLLFIWYEEAKYFKNVEFLQQDHEKELNDLCKFIFNNNENSMFNQNQNINSSNNVRKNYKYRTKSIRKIASFNSDLVNQLRKSNIRP